MPEREFFSYRFAVPGYTFILIIIAVNYIPMLKILEVTKAGEVFGAFLAFLSLFSASALGFLISQIWWVRFDGKGRAFGIKKCKLAEKAFVKKLDERKLKTCQNMSEVDRKKVLELMSDYILLHSKKHEEKTFSKLWRYSERKWDMYHVLSSTFIALQIAYALGIALRIYYEMSLFESPFTIYENQGLLAELLAQVFFFFSVIFLSLIIKRGIRNLETEYCRTLTAIIRTAKIEDEEDFKKVFQEYLEEKTENSHGQLK